MHRGTSYGGWTGGAALDGVRPDDVIGYRFDTGISLDDHVGIVVTVNGGTISTIEGNYSNGVRHNTVARGNAEISGYARAQGR